jgi:hypothetical protein
VIRIENATANCRVLASLPIHMALTVAPLSCPDGRQCARQTIAEARAILEID